MAQRDDLPAAAEDRLDYRADGSPRRCCFIMLAIAVVVAIHIARRTMRTNRGGDYRLFEAAQLTAAQHRATAESYAAQGELGRGDSSPTARRRPPARGDRRTEPGSRPHRQRTGRATPARPCPTLTDELSQAATAFNDVTYGEQPGTQAAYQMIADLDDHLRSRSPAVPAAAGQPAARRLMGAGPVMATIAARPAAADRTAVQRWRSWRWAVLTLVVLAVIAGDRRLPDRTAARRSDGSGRRPDPTAPMRW